MKKSDRTKQRILAAGLRTWPDTRLRVVADEARLTHSGVLYHFPQGTLKDEIAKHAVKSHDSKIILQLIATGHPAVRGMAPSDRIKHFNKI